MLYCQTIFQEIQNIPSSAWKKVNAKLLYVVFLDFHTLYHNTDKIKIIVLSHILCTPLRLNWASMMSDDKHPGYSRNHVGVLWLCLTSRLRPTPLQAEIISKYPIPGRFLRSH